MGSIVLCPRCASHLGLPPEADSDAQVQCPICDAEFSLVAAPPRELPRARVVARVDEPAANLGETIDLAASLRPLLRAAADAGVGHSSSPAKELAATHDESPGDATPTDEGSSTMSLPVEKTLQLGSSRLDQLLSDLMKPPVPAAARSEFEESFDEIDGVSEPSDESSSELLDEGLEEELDSEPVEDDEFVTTQFDVRDMPAEFEGRTKLKRRPTSVVRSLAGIVGGGVIGIALGGYGLLWLRGLEGDVLGLSRWLPASLLPSSAPQTADGDAADRHLPSAPGKETLAVDTGAAAPEELASDAAPSEASSDDSNAVGGEPTGRDARPVIVRLDSQVTPTIATAPLAGGPTPDGAAAMASASAASSDRPTIWPTTAIVGDLREPRLFSQVELADALRSAEAAHERFVASDLTKENQSQMGKDYIQLCVLAERMTLTDPADYGNEVISDQLAAKELFRGLTKNPARRDDLALIAARWLQHGRRQNQGVILIGRIGELRARGEWTEYVVNVKLGDEELPTTVLMDRLKYSTGDDVAMVGVIVSQPAASLSDYDGEAPQVVVAGYGFDPDGDLKPVDAALPNVEELEAGLGIE